MPSASILDGKSKYLVKIHHTGGVREFFRLKLATLLLRFFYKSWQLKPIFVESCYSTNTKTKPVVWSINNATQLFPLLVGSHSTIW